ncbi:MAG: hypothetical protein HY460_02410 [Parcubacteria group bacterium]|nr:hypothetical protein [Parcubacteria group bacterium]
MGTIIAGFVEVFLFLVQLLSDEAENVVERVGIRAGYYLRQLKRLALGVLIFPVPLLLLGIIGVPWLVGLVALWWAGWTIFLAAYAAPVAIAIDLLMDAAENRRTTIQQDGVQTSVRTINARESSRRWVNIMLSFLIFELGMALYLCVVPINQAPHLVPVVAVGAAFLAVAAYRWDTGGRFWRWMAVAAASVIVLLATVSIYFPASAAGVKEDVGSLDKTFNECREKHGSMRCLQKYLGFSRTRSGAFPGPEPTPVRLNATTFLIPAGKEIATGLHVRSTHPPPLLCPRKPHPRPYFVVYEMGGSGVGGSGVAVEAPGSDCFVSFRSVIGEEIKLRGGVEQATVEVILK